MEIAAPRVPSPVRLRSRFDARRPRLPCLLPLAPHRGAPWMPSRSSRGTRGAALPSLNGCFAVVVSPIAD
uniref:Uncharacterized protein n=1 Tax=Triticum urartu TaxID=4572 RepID=A0A8R7U4D0_TRIUA